MNLDDILRAEVLRKYKSNKSDAMLTTMEREEKIGMETRSWTEFMGLAKQSWHP